MKWAPDIINLVKPYPSQHHANPAEANIKVSNIRYCRSQQTLRHISFVAVLADTPVSPSASHPNIYETDAKIEVGLEREKDEDGDGKFKFKAKTNKDNFFIQFALKIPADAGSSLNAADLKALDTLFFLFPLSPDLLNFGEWADLHRTLGMNGGTQRHHLFIEVKVWAVQRVAETFFRIGDSQLPVDTRYFLVKIRYVLTGHAWGLEPDHLFGRHNLGCRSTEFFDHLRMVKYRRVLHLHI